MPDTYQHAKATFKRLRCEDKRKGGGRCRGKPSWAVELHDGRKLILCSSHWVSRDKLEGFRRWASLYVVWAWLVDNGRAA